MEIRLGSGRETAPFAEYAPGAAGGIATNEIDQFGFHCAGRDVGASRGMLRMSTGRIVMRRLQHNDLCVTCQPINAR